MEIVYQGLGLMAAGLIAWLLYRYVRHHPEQLSRENLSKSFSSMGILALLLIGFVTLLVLIVRAT